MSIINNAHPGSQIRLLCLIDRMVIRNRKYASISRQELIDTCRPENLPNSEGAKRRFEDNLHFWLEERLWAEEDGGIKIKHSTITEQDLPSRVIAQCIKNQAEKDILQGNRIEPLLRTITTLLCQDQYSFQGQQQSYHSLDTPPSIAKAINSRLPSDLSINETNEAYTLKDWGVFLGLLEPFGKGVIIDPTRAITPILKFLFVNTDTLFIRDFITSLAVWLPMLDGGNYRKMIEPILEKQGWRPPLENRVSASLSHALLRLEAGFQLILDQPADDTKSMVLITTDSKERSVGTVRYRRAK